MPLAVLHADEHLLAIDKPAGRIVIPGRGAPERTIREEVGERYGRLWVVHRLDRGTSGVLLFARTAFAHRLVNLAFDRHEVTKRYLALVRGTAPVHHAVDAPIAPARRGRMRAAAPGDARGKPARTEFRVIETFPARLPLPALTLVEAAPQTGRTHQIRVHLAAAGTPLAFDPDYGEAVPLHDEAGAILLARTPLHASSLELRHPSTGALLRIDSPLPPDIEATVRAARAAR